MARNTIEKSKNALKIVILFSSRVISHGGDADWPRRSCVEYLSLGLFERKSVLR